MIELTPRSRPTQAIANIAATEKTDTATENALPPCAKRQMKVPKTLAFDIQRMTRDSVTENTAGLEYMPVAEVQTISPSEALDQMLDSVLRDHSDLLSDTAKTAIQPQGTLRKYLLNMVNNASRGKELLAIFNQFLGVALKLDNTNLKKSSLESILGLPGTELNCLDGMYERIAIANRNMSSAGSLAQRLHLSAVDKLFSRIEQRSTGLHIGNQVHRHSHANNPEFLQSNLDEYCGLMVNEINQLISEEIEPVLQSIENVVYEKGRQDTYSLLKQLGEQKAGIVSLFHPHVPDSEVDTSQSGGDAGEGEFHETHAYFGDLDENTYLPVRLNRDQIYSNLFSRLRNHIRPMSKIAVVLSNPECAAGLAKGIFNATEKSVLDLTEAELSLSNDDRFITAERNKALIEKIRVRLPIYLTETASSINTLLENNLIDVKTLLESESFKTELNDLLVVPFLEKQTSIAPSSNSGSSITVTNYKKTIEISKVGLLYQVAIKLYVAAVVQDLNHEQRDRLKNNIIAQCEGVGLHRDSRFNELEKACLYAEEAKQGNFEAAKNLSTYLKNNQLPNGPLLAELKDRFASALCQLIETTPNAKIHELVDFFKACKDSLNLNSFTNTTCALLNRLGELDQTKANNKITCQALDTIKSYYFEGSTEATPEQTLKVMAALAQNMGKLHAAKLLSSPQTIASGGLARSQDPQTKAYKLIKQYLVKQTDKSGQLKMEFLKNLWAGDAIGQFSDATRSLSGAHWKKILTSVAGNAALYGSGAGGFEYLADHVSDSIATIAKEKQGYTIELTGLHASKQNTEATITNLESIINQSADKKSAIRAEMNLLIDEYRNGDERAAFDEFMQATLPDSSTESITATGVVYEVDWNYQARTSLSPEAQQIYDEFFELKNQHELAHDKEYFAFLSLEQKNDELLDLQNQVDAAEGRLPIKMAAAQQAEEQLIKRKGQINNWTKAMPAIAEGAALLGSGAIGAAGQIASAVAKEANTWGPIGLTKTVRTLYKASQENPLASVRDASVLLTPLAIEHFVTQSMKENSTANYLDDAAGAWKQVLSKLEGDSIGLRTEQKVGLVVSFVKQFSVLGKFGLEKEKSREMIHSVLDSLEPNQALKSLLTNIRKQSRSASETVMQYLLDKHDEAVQTNQTNKQLPTQEVQRLRNILGIKTPMQPVHAFDHTRIAALKVGQTIRPAWANTATLAAAITRRPVNDAISKVKADRELQVKKMQHKLETSKALYERIQSMRMKVD